MNPTSPTPASLEDQVREAAYFQWLDRGCPIGDDWANWFSAEKQLGAPLATATLAIVEPHSFTPAFSWPAANRPTNVAHAKHSAAPDHRPEIRASGAVQRTRARHQGGGTRGSART